MTEVTVILDGASEPVRGEEPTSLERAATPVLDALAQLGTLRRLETTPAGLPAGSETGCAVLLGWVPPAPVDRGSLEAAARGIAIGDDEIARRVDVLTAAGARADGVDVERVAQAIEVAATHGPGADAAAPPRVHRLAEHRLLVTGLAPAVDAAVRAGADVAASLRRWPTGEPVPRRLDERTVVIGAPGAVTGLARLLGARVIVPEGQRGTAREPLGPLADAALELLVRDEADRIVIHVAGPDEAAHERDPDLKVQVLEAADEELLVPLAAAVHDIGGVLEIVIDHGCDPRDGAHHADPTPALRWLADDVPAPADPDGDGAADEGPAPRIDPRDVDPEAPGLASGLDPEDLPVMALPKRRASQGAQTGRRLTERWVEPLPVEQPPVRGEENAA